MIERGWERKRDRYKELVVTGMYLVNNDLLQVDLVRVEKLYVVAHD